MTMQNYRLELSYDGSRYRGWQRLPGSALTLQGKLEEILTELFGQPIEVNGSGRTDAGVHALGQIVSFRAPRRSPEILLAQLRHKLPEDMGALSLAHAPERFHARLSAVEKTYIYRIWNSEAPDVFQRRYRVQMGKKLDFSAMEQAASLMVGTHDFLAFCSNKHFKKSSLRTLKALKIERLEEEVRFIFTADGFLYNMARILAGTLLEVGMGKRTADQIPEIFDSRLRENAGETAPAKGLCLLEVRY